MTTLYKLTTQDYKTRVGFPEETQWGVNVTHTASGKGALCSNGWLHAYTHPLLAVLFNRMHANIDDPVLWECDGEIGITDRGIKVGCTRLTTIRTIPLPSITTEQRVHFAMLCALTIYDDPLFISWCNDWLSGKDRSIATINKAHKRISRYSLDILPYTVNEMTTDVAAAVTRAAYAATRAAGEDRSVHLEEGENVAEWWSAEATTWTANAARLATEVWAMWAQAELDLIVLAKQVAG